MQDAIESRLGEAGYDHYEVSAYARRERQGSDPLITHHSSLITARSARCAHNLNYWTFGDYLGIGAGAHGKLSFSDRIVRQTRVRHPEAYMKAAEQGNATQEERAVDTGEVGFEFMMNALRLNGGFPARLFEERAGLPLTAVLRDLDEAERRGFITRDHERIAPTALGQRFLNDLIQIFLPEAAAAGKHR
jgi:oxygen-independent coproporphyrinogen-3 oxidase